MASSTSNIELLPRVLRNAAIPMLFAAMAVGTFLTLTHSDATTILAGCIASAAVIALLILSGVLLALVFLTSRR